MKVLEADLSFPFNDVKPSWCWSFPNAGAELSGANVDGGMRLSTREMRRLCHSEHAGLVRHGALVQVGGPYTFRCERSVLSIPTYRSTLPISEHPACASALETLVLFSI
jgi:hypothetical protein